MSTPTTAPIRTVPLTPKEQEIFTLVGQGLSSHEIAAQLGKSHKTVDAQRTTIRIKLRCKNSREVLRLATQVQIGRETVTA